MELSGKAKVKLYNVKGFEQYYKISNFGLVYSMRRDRFLKPHINKSNGYKCIDFYVNGKRTKHTIHNLVATHFVDGFKKGLEVNHIDCNKLNNNYSNLEWVTRSENTQHAYDNGLINRGNRGGDRISEKFKNRTKTRPEARTKAIEKANELLNERL